MKIILLKILFIFHLVFLTNVKVALAETNECDLEFYVDKNEVKSSVCLKKLAGKKLFIGNNQTDDTLPRKEIELDDFYIQTTEVSQLLWNQLMETNPSHFIGDLRPVDSVAVKDIEKFIKKLNKITGENFRLPTEIEWEYGARFGASENFLSSKLSDFFDHKCLARKSTCNLKEFKSNEISVYGMYGNVAEWTSTKAEVYSHSEKITSSGYIVRGPVYFENREFGTEYFISYRPSISKSYTNRYLGFRLVMDSPKNNVK